MQLRWLLSACKHSQNHQCCHLRGSLCAINPSLRASRGDALRAVMPLELRLAPITPPLGIFCKQELVLALSSAPAVAHCGDQSEGEDGLAKGSVGRSAQTNSRGHCSPPCGCVGAVAAQLSPQGAPPWSRGNACRQPFKGREKKSHKCRCC